MIHSVVGTRVTRRLVAVCITSAALTGCHADAISGGTPFVECSDQPGCQTATTPVAPLVVAALDDATSRSAQVLNATTRAGITAPIARLEAALVARDISRGRIELLATLDAITAAERADPATRPDLGVIRLGLAPAARSLGLSFSVIESPID
ncbi:MAG: hypothetical protein ABI852_14820 [Gemmatimonadaceae bacterium]